MDILQLPAHMIEQIFDYLSYDEVAKCRLVCKDIDRICQSILNRGFSKMCKLHVQQMKKIKTQLPRRESERRIHHLSRHADILQCIETRISMMTMTYSKYIDANMCCFIPGKVIDEVLRLLKLVENTSQQLRAREILQELRDITSMAIEHFDEKIAPDLKKLYLENAKLQFPLKGGLAMIMSAMSGGSPSTQISLADDSINLDSSTASNPERSCNTSHVSNFLISKLNARIKREMKTIERLRSFQMRQMKMMRAQSSQIAELRSQIVDLQTKNREISLHLMKENRHENVSASSGPSSSLVDTDSSSFSRPRKPNIKPRTATIILKRCIEEFSGKKTSEDEKPSKIPKNCP